MKSKRRVTTDQDLLPRITANPKIFGGKPIIRDMRISVELILSLLAQAYEKSGDQTRATDYYRKVLASNAHNPTNAFARPLAKKKLGTKTFGLILRAAENASSACSYFP